jgi:dihydroorotate dehydrogenase (fumarate)
MKEEFGEAKIKNIECLIRDEFGIDLSSSYLDLELKNPIIVAPGPLSQTTSQIERAVRAGYGGMVLKSVIGEDKNGNASMKSLRTKPSFVRWVKDEEGNPIFHWNGGLDLRSLAEYLRFTEEAFQLGKKLGFPLILSFLCHLPKDRDEEWKVEEWEYTVRRLDEAASAMYEERPTIFEIDFCPFLKREKLTVDKETVARWYREAPKLIKDVSPDAKVVLKILNLDFGLEFQMEMVKASKEGNADGVVIANRFFRKYMDVRTKEEYFTAHGGKELRELNQRQITEVKKNMDIFVSATGGIYSGKHISEYLSLRAENIQLLTYIMKNGFEESFRNLLFNPENGLLISLIRERQTEH